MTPPLPSHLATNQRQPPRGGAGREGGYKSEKVAFDQPLLTKLPSPPEPKSFVVSALVRNDLMPIDAIYMNKMRLTQRILCFEISGFRWGCPVWGFDWHLTASTSWEPLHTSQEETRIPHKTSWTAGKLPNGCALKLSDFLNSEIQKDTEILKVYNSWSLDVEREDLKSINCDISCVSE